MLKQTVYVTYDLPQGTESASVARGAKRISVEGRVVRSQVGEFKMASGQKVPGVRLSIVNDEEENLEKHLVEIPANAQNVQVHLDTIPDRYRSALDSAA